MPHYSKRPPPIDALPLGTGDFEAVSYPHLPPPPRAPIFHRSMTPPGGGVGRPAHGYGYPSRHAPALVPQAANSLSPMAMAAAHDAGATGPQRAQPTVVIRSRPSAIVGMGILLTGAIIGAAFGITMRARQTASEDAFAAQQAPQAEQVAAVVAPAPSPAPSPVAPIGMTPNAGPAVLPQGPAALPPQAYANVPFGSLVVSPAPSQQTPAVQQPAARAPAVAAPPKAPQKYVAWSAKPAGGAHPSLSAKVNPPAKDKDKDDGYKVASAGNDEPAPPPSKSKPSKEPREPKEPAEPKETRKAEAKPAKASRSTDDADKVLKAAMGATENTL